MVASMAVFREVLESLSYVAQIVAVGVLIYAVYSYLLQRQQLNFDVITNCTSRFQAILPGLYSYDERQKKEAKRKYVDLCNEELFYFLNGYLPPDVIEEWIDGMVLYLPHYDGDEWCPLPDDHSEPHRVNPEMLERYSRIREMFDVGGCYDPKIYEHRRELFSEIRGNIEQNARKPQFSFGR